MKRFRITYAETVEAESLTAALLRAVNCAPTRISINAVVRDYADGVKVWANKESFDKGEEPAFVIGPAE